MGYNKTAWVEGVAPGISAVNLNNLETQYDEILMRIKAGSVTDTTGADGKIAVAFAAAFASTPVVVITLFGDVDYYPVITAKSTDGFTVKILRTYHKHSQGSTGTGTSHKHSNPNTSSKSAGTPSGTIGNESSHTHGISFTSGAGSAHKHTQGITGVPDSTIPLRLAIGDATILFAAPTSGASPTSSFYGQNTTALINMPWEFHDHTNPDTANESSHTHSVSGTSGAGSSHNHSFSGNALGTHYHSQGNTGYESGHTHSNPDTAEVNAGNLLATIEVTFSYIAMIP